MSYSAYVVSAIFVTVRTGSTRLPRKALLPIFKGVGVLEFLLERVKHENKEPLVVVCTTILEEDDTIAEIAVRHGAEVFRGSVEDKLVRWRDACRAFNVERFVTADGDDLFCDPGLLARGLDKLRVDELDFVSAPQAPCGGFTYGISASALEEVCRIKTSDQTEMMWVYFTETGLFKLGELEIQSDMARPEYRLTLDYPEDLEFFKRVISHFGGNPKVPLQKIVSYLDKNPEVRGINGWRQADFLLNQSKNTHLEIANDH
jgi:spore coat polysaccharide biosynthesis protein SpsF